MDLGGTGRVPRRRVQRDQAPDIAPRDVIERMRAAAGADETVLALGRQTVVSRPTLLKALMAVARDDPYYPYLYLGTYGSGSLERRAKEVFSELSKPVKNPWSGASFSPQVWGLAGAVDVKFDTQDPLYFEYLDLFWAVVFPYEWARAQALQRFVDTYLPSGMRNGLRNTIRDNSVKNDEGPELRRWTISQLTGGEDLFDGLASVRDYAPLDAAFARRVLASLPALRASMIYRAEDLAAVEAGIAPLAASASTTLVRPELLADSAAYVDGPSGATRPATSDSGGLELADDCRESPADDDSRVRPIEEWRERFVRRARAALYSSARSLTGIPQLAEDAWAVAVTRAIKRSRPTDWTVPVSQFAEWGTEGEQPAPVLYVRFESLVNGGRLWRAIDVCLSDELVAGDLRDRDVEKDRWVSVGRSDADEPTVRPLPIINSADIADALQTADDDQSIVLYELVATLGEFARGVRKKHPKRLPEELIRRIRNIVGDLREQGRISGRVRADSVLDLLGDGFYRALERAINDEAEQENVRKPVELAPRRDVTYACDRGHQITLPMAAEAVAPDSWDCPRCGIPARLVTDGEHQVERFKGGS